MLIFNLSPAILYGPKEEGMMNTQAAKVIDLQAYRTARTSREARQAAPVSPMTGYAVPMVWCPVWVMVPPAMMGAFYR